MKNGERPLHTVILPEVVLSGFFFLVGSVRDDL